MEDPNSLSHRMIPMRSSRLARAERPASRENERNEKAGGGRENIPRKAANGPPAANTRRALGDIGNLVSSMGARGQVSKDGVKGSVKQDFLITWGAKQRRSAVAAAGEEVKAATTAAEVKLESNDNEPEARTDPNSSSDWTENAPAPGLPPPVPRLKTFKKRTAVKKITSLTATLTLRSAACCEKDAELLVSKEQLPDIDEADIHNQLAVVDYVEDIYSFYRKAEAQSCVDPNYMNRQADINERMRAILIDWLIEVEQKFCLMPETLFLTTSLIDRYLSAVTVSRKNLQLVGVTAMLLAAKYEEVLAPEVEAVVFISDDAYTREQVLAMEKAMLNTLKFNLTVPTPYVFMMRFLKAASSDKQMEMLAFFLVELCLVEYAMVKYPPSQLAAAAVYTASHALGRVPYWTPTLARHSGYTECQLKACSQMMAKFHRKGGEGKLHVVHKKYSSPKFHSVATLPPAEITDSDHESNSPAS